MTYQCIKTYVMGQRWDDELKANVYLEHDAKAKEADAGDELDALTRQRMTLFPGETYRQAMHHVLADNPDLKQRYAKGGVK